MEGDNSKEETNQAPANQAESGNNNEFDNGRGDVRGARGAESSADIIMAGN